MLSSSGLTTPASSITHGGGAVQSKILGHRQPTPSSEGLAISYNVDYDGSSYRPMTGDLGEHDAAVSIRWDQNNEAIPRLRKKPEEFVPAFDPTTELSNRIDSVLDVYAEMYGEFGDDDDDEEDRDHELDGNHGGQPYEAKHADTDEEAMRTPEIARNRPLKRTSQLISSPASSERRAQTPIVPLPLEGYHNVETPQTRPWDERGKTGLYGGGGRGADDHETGWVGAPVAASSAQGSREENIHYDDEDEDDEDDEDEDDTDQTHYDEDDEDDDDNYDEYINGPASRPAEHGRSSLSVPNHGARNASVSSTGRNSSRHASIASNRRASKQSTKSVRHAPPNHANELSNGYLDYRTPAPGTTPTALSAAVLRRQPQQQQQQPQQPSQLGAKRQQGPSNPPPISASPRGPPLGYSPEPTRLKKRSSLSANAKPPRAVADEARKAAMAKVPVIPTPKVSNPLPAGVQPVPALGRRKSAFRWGGRSKKAPVISNPILPEGFVESLGMETFALTPGCAAPDHKGSRSPVVKATPSSKPTLSSFVPIPSSKKEKTPAPRPRKAPASARGPIRVGSPILQSSSFEGISKDDSIVRQPASPLPISPTPLSPPVNSGAPAPRVAIGSLRPDPSDPRVSDVSSVISDAFHRLSRESELSYTPSKSSSLNEAEEARRAYFEGLRRNTQGEVSANSNVPARGPTRAIDSSQSTTPQINSKQAAEGAFRDPWGGPTHKRNPTGSSPSESSTQDHHYSTPQASISSRDSYMHAMQGTNASHRGSESSVYSDSDGAADNRVSGYSYGSYYEQQAEPAVPIAPLNFAKRSELDGVSNAKVDSNSRSTYGPRGSEASVKTFTAPYSAAPVRLAAVPQWRDAPQIGTTGFRNPFG